MCPFRPMLPSSGRPGFFFLSFCAPLRIFLSLIAHPKKAQSNLNLNAYLSLNKAHTLLFEAKGTEGSVTSNFFPKMYYLVYISCCEQLLYALHFLLLCDYTMSLKPGWNCEVFICWFTSNNHHWCRPECTMS